MEKSNFFFIIFNGYNKMDKCDPGHYPIVPGRSVAKKWSKNKNLSYGIYDRLSNESIFISY